MIEKQFRHILITKTARFIALSLFFASAFSSYAADVSAPNVDAINSAAPIREALIVAPEQTVETVETAEPDTSEANPPAEAVSYDEAVFPADEPSLTALPVDNVWQRIRGGFAMNELESPLVRNHEKWYANHPEYVLRMSERANRYLFYIIEEVERRGMPSEIALLPIIESAFNPGANSVASASGIWQFIPSTGKHFGMEQNWWYDGRRDVIGATTGALDYLEKLHGMFGDWELALAAYNWGEGAVARAQAKNRRLGKPTDYSHLRMPAETANYVPKLLAVKNIVADPARFGVVLYDIPNKPYFAAVTPSKPMDVKRAAELAEISMAEFTALNPGNNRPVILEDHADVILLPVAKVETFRKNLEQSNQRLVSWRPYKSDKGDSFADVAERFDMTLDELRAANGISKLSTHSAGQTLLVRAGEDEEYEGFTPFNMHASAVRELAGVQESKRKVKLRSYTVRKGDTIASLSKKLHVSQASLLKLNRGNSRLRPGMRFSIKPVATKSSKRITTKKSTSGRKATSQSARSKRTATPPKKKAPVKKKVPPKRPVKSTQR